MKKIIGKLFIVICIIMAMKSAWLYAYHHAKHADNLPSLESLQVDDLKDLVGYQQKQLISVWGEPDDTNSANQDIWNLEGRESLVVTYARNGKVTEVVIATP